MKARYVECVRTVVTPQEAATAFRYACNQHWNTSKPETIATLMAQSALETGRWASMFAFNPSNIKCGQDTPGLFTCLPIINEVIDGVVRWFDPVSEVSDRAKARRIGQRYDVPDGHPQNRFRAFESFTDGVVDKLYFLKKPKRAAALAAALGGSPGAYCHELKKVGYYTANEEQYTRSVVSLFTTYLPLCQAKADEPAPLPEPVETQLCSDMAECIRTELPDWLTSRLTVLHEQHRQDMWDELRRRD